jgi:hypothetical protein
MRRVAELFGVPATRPASAPRSAVLRRPRHDSERRGELRFADGSLTRIMTASGDSIPGLLIDVTFDGARIWSQQALPIEQLLRCRVKFTERIVDLAMRVKWSRRTDDGWEYGLAYSPVLPGTENTMVNYLMFVLNRKPQLAER